MEDEEHLGAHDLLNQKASCKQNGKTGERALSLCARESHLDPRQASFLTASCVCVCVS